MTDLTKIHLMSLIKFEDGEFHFALVGHDDGTWKIMDCDTKEDISDKVVIPPEFHKY